jgi:hypothetical protein
MELICQDCRAVIQISDERVPPNSAFRLTCPRCKSKIVVSMKTPENQEADKIAMSTATGSNEVYPPIDDAPGESVGEEMDTLQLGQPAVLLCLDRDHPCGGLKSVLQDMGYVVDRAAAVDQALQRLRFNQYRLIVLAEEFGGSVPNPVAGYLAELNMNIRRDMFVVLIGERFKTADHLQAFIESVSLVLHPDDLPQSQALLTRCLQDYERFYKVFVDCLIEAGKKL